jgi:hypothetical protein
MRDEFMRAAREIAEAGPRKNPWLPLDLGIAFVTSGIFELFAWWMRQPEDYPVDNVIKLFNALIIDTAGRPRRNVLSDEYDAGETPAKPDDDQAQWPAKRRASA